MRFVFVVISLVALCSGARRDRGRDDSERPRGPRPDRFEPRSGGPNRTRDALRGPGGGIDTSRWVSLTHPLSPNAPVYTGVYTPFKVDAARSQAKTEWPGSSLDGAFVAFNYIEFFEHTGTHIDAPYHFWENGKKEDDLTWSDLTGPVVVVNLRRKVADEGRDAKATVEDLEKFVEDNGPLPEKAFVLFDFGWAAHYWNNDFYLYKDANKTAGVIASPCVSGDAYRWLWNNTDLLGIGADTVNPDCIDDPTWPVHIGLLQRNRIIIENLKAMDGVPPLGAHLMIFPLHQEDGTGGPARIVAVLPQ